MKIRFLIILFLCFFFMPTGVDLLAQSNSTKKERNLITQGNKLYNDGKYKEAMQKYSMALQENPSSLVGKYNLGLSQIRLGSNSSDTTQTAKEMLAKGCQAMEQVANRGKENPDLASRANYNLGNVAFNSEDYQKAEGLYKQALRFNPDDNNARRNLRITQLKLKQSQKQDKNNDNKEDQDKDKEEKQDQNQNQQNQNQDQNKDQQPPKQNQSDINPQTAEQILNAMENKENQTRARVANQQGEKSRGASRSRLNW